MAVYFQDPTTLALQREAIKRVKEMQQRAQSSIEQQTEKEPMPQPSAENVPPQNSGRNTYQNTPQNPPNNIFQQLFGGAAANSRQNRQNQPPPKGIADLLKRQGLGDSLGGMGQSIQSTVSSVSQPIADILDSFGIDGEKLIILMVMWAVFNEHKDNKTLLMALGYLLI